MALGQMRSFNPVEHRVQRAGQLRQVVPSFHRNAGRKVIGGNRCGGFAHGADGAHDLAGCQPGDARRQGQSPGCYAKEHRCLPVGFVLGTADEVRNDQVRLVAFAVGPGGIFRLGFRPADRPVVAFQDSRGLRVIENPSQEHRVFSQPAPGLVCGGSCGEHPPVGLADDRFAGHWLLAGQIAFHQFAHGGKRPGSLRVQPLSRECPELLDFLRDAHVGCLGDLAGG